MFFNAGSNIKDAGLGVFVIDMVGSGVWIVPVDRIFSVGFVVAIVVPWLMGEDFDVGTGVVDGCNEGEIDGAGFDIVIAVVLSLSLQAIELVMISITAIRSNRYFTFNLI